ncbi:hypothetical protein BHE74_00029330 [Ensete ventricosum]|nr:hypothetical protein BHE74_00029330 [Ensete ventricosum]RZS07170.1 hypothetical protein BHM03_00037959 [Ensete ventricosum]
MLSFFTSLHSLPLPSRWHRSSDGLLLSLSSIITHLKRLRHTYLPPLPRVLRLVSTLPLLAAHGVFVRVL